MTGWCMLTVKPLMDIGPTVYGWMSALYKIESGHLVCPGEHEMPGGGGDGPQRESLQFDNAFGVDQCSIGVPPPI